MQTKHKAYIAIAALSTLAAIGGGVALYRANTPAAMGHFESLPTPIYVNNAPSVPLTATLPAPPVFNTGSIEIVVTWTQQLPVLASDELAYAYPSGGSGGWRMTYFTSSNEFDFTINQGLVGQTQNSRIDGRKLLVINRKTHYVCVWSPAPLGGMETQCCQQGACDQPSELSSAFTHVAAFSAVRFGETVSGTSLAAYATWHRVAVYRERLTPLQIREAAANAGIAPAYYVVALGDSLTDSYDDHHARLQQLLAPGTSTGAAVSNWGKSGDTAELALRRLPRAMQAPQNAVIVLLGTNDVLNPAYNHTATETEKFLREIYGCVTRHGADLVVLTTTPAVNTAFGASWYTAEHLTQQTALNTWIAAFPDAFAVEDAYALFNTAANGTFCGYPTLNTCSYDGLHPRGRYTIPPSPVYPNGADVLGEAEWAAMGSPTY